MGVLTSFLKCIEDQSKTEVSGVSQKSELFSAGFEHPVTVVHGGS